MGGEATDDFAEDDRPCAGPGEAGAWPAAESESERAPAAVSEGSGDRGALPGRAQEGLDRIRGRLPFRIREIHPDNDRDAQRCAAEILPEGLGPDVARAWSTGTGHACERWWGGGGWIRPESC